MIAGNGADIAGPQASRLAQYMTCIYWALTVLVKVSLGLLRAH